MLKTYLKGWVDTVEDQSCIPVSHQFKFVSHKINISHFKNDVIGHLTREVQVRWPVGLHHEMRKIYRETNENGLVYNAQSVITLFYSCAATNGT